VFDVISPLICIFFTFSNGHISPEPMKTFANHKQHFSSYVEFYVININIQGVKI